MGMCEDVKSFLARFVSPSSGPRTGVHISHYYGERQENGFVFSRIVYIDEEAWKAHIDALQLKSY